MISFTSVCTMCGRFSLILCTKAFMPTALSFSSCWSSTSRAMMVPVLPTPALRETDTEKSWAVSVQVQVRWSSSGFHIKLPNRKQALILYLQWTTVGAAAPSLCMCSLTSPLNWIRTSVPCGTPWSGQAVKWKCFTLRSSEVLSCEEDLHRGIRIVSDPS